MFLQEVSATSLRWRYVVNLLIYCISEETNENMDGPQVLKRTTEVLFLSIKQRKQNLYRQTGLLNFMNIELHTLHFSFISKPCNLTNNSILLLF